MSAIIQLDEQVSNLIAAGEVVERPASVVKELMENAIDAGASALTVEIQRGGMSLIRVSDNGDGIPKEDTETAFLRHATSKLRHARDLDAIHTLGFRGEALAAIAAVSRVELLTRTPGADLGTALLLEGGVLREHTDCGCPEGSTLLVRDLFFNTPARLKFMKRDTTEGAAVFALVQRVALAHPAVSVKFLRDGKQELLTPGDGKLSSTLYAVFGRDMALGFVAVEAVGEDITVQGFVSLPACCRGTRGYQHFMVNGRPVRAPLLMAALEEAYRNQKMVGKFPACVLHVTLHPAALDCNVHPAKTEVKFMHERAVFDAVHYAVLSALSKDERHPSLSVDAPPQMPKPVAVFPSQPSPTAPLRTVGTFSQMSTQRFRDSAGQHAATLPLQRVTAPPSPAPVAPSPLNATPRQRDPAMRVPTPVMSANSPPEDRVLELEVRPPEATIPWRIVGEVMDTYIVVESGQDLHLIDKHAAHERMQFDRMQQEDYQPMAQSLLEPLLLRLPPEESAALEENLDLLAGFGFLLERFGGGVLLLRELPDALSATEVEALLSDLAHAFLRGRQSGTQSRRDEILHSVACKAAIKGGQKSAPEELLPIAEAVLSGTVKYCPHGRPVAVTLTRAQLEKRFGRA